MKFFYIGANVRWLMSTTPWPDEPMYHEMMITFQRAYKDATRGTRVTDTPSFGPDFSHIDASPDYNHLKEQPLESSIYTQLFSLVQSSGGVCYKSHLAQDVDGRPRLPAVGGFVASIRRSGMTFTTSRNSVGDSRVTFIDRTGPADTDPQYPSAGQIEDIFYHRRLEGSRTVVEPFVVVKKYVPLSADHSPHDPFRRFEDLQTRIYYDEFFPDLRVVPLRDIVAHFASLVYTPPGIERPCVIVRSLDRVSKPSL